MVNTTLPSQSHPTSLLTFPIHPLTLSKNTPFTAIKLYKRGDFLFIQYSFSMKCHRGIEENFKSNCPFYFILVSTLYAVTTNICCNYNSLQSPFHRKLDLFTLWKWTYWQEQTIGPLKIQIESFILSWNPNHCPSLFGNKNFFLFPESKSTTNGSTIVAGTNW